MYSPPGKNDIDPNPFVAVFYFIFFGLMIGDIGYGLILFISLTLVLVIVKPQNLGVKNLLMIVVMGSVSAILWGIFFGSFFGFTSSDNELLARILPRPVINPIEDAIFFLGLAMALGVVHVMAGIALKFYNLCRRGMLGDAILDAGFRLTFFIGVILFLSSFMFDGIDIVGTVGIVVAATSVGIIALTAGRKRRGIGKAVGGFGGVYSCFVGYFSDILSYARLFGLGLVGAVIAMVANEMAAMMSGNPILMVFGIIVALALHAFNLAIGLLSAYIHNARLQFIEFFSKFYEGDGVIFNPMGGNLRYTRIRSILDTMVVVDEIAVNQG